MNLKKLMKVKDSGGLKYVKDDSLDDFNPSSTLKGFGKEGTDLYVSAFTNADEQTVGTMLERAGVELISFRKGAGINSINTFCASVPNTVENAYILIDTLKSIHTWAIHYAIDQHPNIYSSQISNTLWSSKSTKDIISIMSRGM